MNCTRKLICRLLQTKRTANRTIKTFIKLLSKIKMYLRENNVEYLVEKDRENMVENAELYDEEKEMSKIIVEIRKKYDIEKIKTAKIEKNIAFLEEEKHQLANTFTKQ